jgi:lipopolysaccharide biosynthesis glycosyltransferase
MVYVYALVSSGKDYYLEQAFLSIYSLRKYNNNANVILLVDQATFDSLTGIRENIKKIVTKIKIVDISNSFTPMEKSRFIKTSMYNHVDTDFLYIDCDTIICEELDFSDIDMQFGAVLDVHVLLSEHSQKQEIMKRNSVCDFKEANQIKTHYNSGILYVKKSKENAEFFSLWHTLWLFTRTKGIRADQPSFNQANALKNIIQPLPDEWNCQLIRGGIKYLVDAKIIHYFASSDILGINHVYALNNIAVFEEIKKTGEISQQVENLLSKPKNAFCDGDAIISADIIPKLLSTSSFKGLVYLYKHSPFKFRVVNKLFSLFVKGSK